MPLLVGAFLGTFFTWLPASSVAFDGRLHAREFKQEGTTAGASYRQTSILEEASANQSVPLGSLLRFGVDGRFLRELYTSRVEGLSSRLDRRTGVAGFSFDLNQKGVRLNVNGENLEQRNSGSGTDTPRLDRRQLGASGAWRVLGARLEGTGLLSDATQESFSGGESHLRDLSGSVSARVPLPRLGQLGYRLSTISTRNMISDARETQTSHSLTFNGVTRFAGGRGQAALRSVLTWFRQSSERVAEAAGVHVRPPLTGGVILDATPEQFDPLEGDLTADPVLFDGDRQTPSTVNLGDSAPVVREIGGDYRNFVYDYGEDVEISSAFLYIDRTFLASALFRFRVFVTDDPEGRSWAELPETAFRAEYQERGTGVQGWSILLASPVRTRYFKLVDVKLGPTVPDLLVTELEVAVRGGEITASERSDTNTQRLAGNASYAISRSVRTGYDLTYRRRVLDGVPGALEDASYGVSAGWTRGLTSLTGRYEYRSLERLNNRSIDNHSQTVTLRRGRTDGAMADLSWYRVAARGTDLRRTSNSLGLGVDWRAAPALRMNQRISYGRLSGDPTYGTSNSIAVSSQVSGQPAPSLALSFDLIDRWVSRQAGNGFSRFGSAGLSVTWLPVPLVSLQSQVQYHLQDEGDWITRNTIAWSPFPGGSLRPTVSANHYRDTRTGDSQRGTSLQVDWQARRTLMFHGGIEKTVDTGGNQRTSPLNTEVSGTWTL